MKAATSSGAYLIAVPHLVSISESAKVRVIKSLAQLSHEKLEKMHSDFALPL
jgi:hypothetical protein